MTKNIFKLSCKKENLNDLGNRINSEIKFYQEKKFIENDNKIIKKRCLNKNFNPHFHSLIYNLENKNIENNIDLIKNNDINKNLNQSNYSSNKKISGKDFISSKFIYKKINTNKIVGYIHSVRTYSFQITSFYFNRKIYKDKEIDIKPNIYSIEVREFAGNELILEKIRRISVYEELFFYAEIKMLGVI
ncbi:hypothetical protein DMUE_2862 [Dictyocoela muelleri]|nr:hypothetical protein DMUE_2862 [Dictyocoela muelleri]